MSITIADGRLAAELANAGDAVVVRGPDGKIIGKTEVEAKLREWRCTP